MKVFQLRTLWLLLWFSLSSVALGETFEVPLAKRKLGSSGPTHTSISVPFPYRTIASSEKATLVQVGMVALIGPESEEDYAVVGPVNPGIAITIHNPSNRRTLVFHQIPQSELDSISGFTSLLDIRDPNELTIEIFSRERAGANQNWHGVQTIQSFLMSLFGLSQDRVLINIWVDSPADEKIFKYADASRYIAVDRSGKRWSTGPYVSDLLRVRKKSSGRVAELVRFVVGADLRRGAKLFEMADAADDVSPKELLPIYNVRLVSDLLSDLNLKTFWFQSTPVQESGSFAYQSYPFRRVVFSDMIVFDELHETYPLPFALLKWDAH